LKPTELVRERVKRIVTRAFDRYGYFPIDKERREFFDASVKILLEITERIESGEPVNVKSVKTNILESIYVSGFELTRVDEVFGYIFQEVEREIRREGFTEEGVVREYYRYSELLSDAVNDYTSLFSEDILDFLNTLDSYAISDTVVSLPPSTSRLVSGSGKPSRGRVKEKFASLFDRKVEKYSDLVIQESVSINGIISDSKTMDFEIPNDINPDLLTATFSGGGKSLFQDISRLYNIAAEFGGYQGSFANSVEYQSLYYEYVMALSYGRRVEFSLLGENFGNFKLLFEGKILGDREIPGLSFLEPLYTTRSGNKQGDGVNPVARKFRDGVSDRYIERIKDLDRIDFASLTLEEIYVRCLKVGDFIQSALNSDLWGLGHTRLHLEILSAVFPSSVDLENRGSGLTGGIYTLLSGHKRIYELIGPGKTRIYGILDRLREMNQSVRVLSENFKSIGFKPGGFVPSLELNYHEPRGEEVRGKLSGLGFSAKEVEDIVSVRSFQELLERLAPMSDSDDVISFFRAFDLTKLIYEFGGQSAIDQYINFLYGKDEQGSLVRLLGFLDVNRSQKSVTIGSKYSKLIGYLVMLTYAVDPVNLQLFNEFLGRNNLDLLGSISLLIEQGENSIIKPREQVSLLSGMVAQMVVSDNSGYESQKPLWNDLIERSAGNIGKGVKGLYNNREGITPTELYELLNNPSSTSPLGEMLNGVRGGRMTSILRYCNIFGLLYSLSDYRNSYQLINRQAEEYGILLEMISGLDELSQALEVGAVVLEEYESLDKQSTGILTDPITRAQNKEFSALIDVISGGNGSGRIQESPGIGNSRVPNGVRVDNSLSPEEASLISSRGAGMGIFSQFPSEDGSYVRLAVSNLLAQGVILSPEGGNSDGAEVEPLDTPLPDRVFEYSLSTPRSSILNVRDKFDPVSSCRRFGGTNCDQLGYEVDRECRRGFNKSLYPETGYGTEYTLGTGIPVDRPLGEKLTGVQIPVSIPRTNTSYVFSQHGLTELSRTPVYKENEMLCASIKDPFEYSACINMLKCKRFEAPYRGKYFLPFCPRSLFGGRLAP
jgi:hypothetical protein